MTIQSETLTLRGELHEIERASQFVVQFCHSRGVEGSHESILILIMEELITNTVKHGSPPAGSPISVTLARSTRGIELYYRDHGRPFNPNTDVPEADLEVTLTRRPAGGLGWPLIKFYCSRLDYRRDGATNLLALTMLIDDGDGQDLPR